MKSLAVAVLLLTSWAAAQVPSPSKATQKAAKANPTQAQLDAVPRVTVDQLKEMLSKDKNVVLIDARAPGSWGSSTTMMPGAIRVPPMEAGQHLAELKKFKDRPVVAYCT